MILTMNALLADIRNENSSWTAAISFFSQHLQNG